MYRNVTDHKPKQRIFDLNNLVKMYEHYLAHASTVEIVSDASNGQTRECTFRKEKDGKSVVGYMELKIATTETKPSETMLTFQLEKGSAHVQIIVLCKKTVDLDGPVVLGYEKEVWQTSATMKLNVSSARKDLRGYQALGQEKVGMRWQERLQFILFILTDLKNHGIDAMPISLL